MQKLLVVVLGMILFSSCKTTYFSASDRRTADKVADWQIQHFSDTVAPKLGWVQAAMYRGMVEWAALNNSERIYNFLSQIGNESKWGLADRVYDADDLCIGQTYFRLYDKYKRNEMVAEVKKRVDYIISHPDNAPLITSDGKYYRNRWGWCDALFMAPPVYARLYQLTGDKKYLDFSLAEFKVTTDSLYDRQHHLFYRDLRLVSNRNAKGEKIFWGRGNGWVYGGLALLLETVPTDHPAYTYYRSLYIDMTQAVIASQDNKGSWHSSLLDPDSAPQPENSASAFFVYGLAYGLNKGLLSGKEHWDAAVKGWRVLQTYVDKDGKLGFIQPIGHAPREITADMTMPYGIGAYLLAATEMQKLKGRK